MPRSSISSLPRWASVVAASLGTFAVGTAISSSVVPERSPTLISSVDQRVGEPRPSYLSALPAITAQKLDAGILTASAAETDLEVEPFVVAATRAPLPSAQTSKLEVATPDPDMFVVTSQGLNVRSGPSGTSGPVFVLLQGEQVRISETDGNWSRVTSPSGQTGWAYTKYLAPASRQ